MNLLPSDEGNKQSRSMMVKINMDSNTIFENTKTNTQWKKTPNPFVRPRFYLLNLINITLFGI
jgi:hypothetical protein